MWVQRYSLLLLISINLLTNGHHFGAARRTASLLQLLFEASYRESPTEQPFLFSNMVSKDVIGALYDYALYHRVELLTLILCVNYVNLGRNCVHFQGIRALTFVL